MRNRVADGLRLLKKDLYRGRYVIAGVAAYYLVMRLAFGISCPSVLVTGRPCPACGMSRAFLLLIRGELGEALAYHPFIIPVLALAGVFLVRRYFLGRSVRILLKYLVILAAAMLLFYLFRMKVYFPHTPPLTFYDDNLINRMI